MFNFRTATTLFFIVLLSLNLLMMLGYSISWVAYLVLITLYLGVSIAASFFMITDFHMKSLSKVYTRKPLLALTFDDGPDPETTPKVLDVLKKYDVRATFFLIGKKISGNEDIVRRMIQEGHLIGAHSYSHGNFFDFYLPKIMKKEFLRTSDEIFRITGKRLRLFRPPYGVINPLVKKALKGLDYHVIGFSNRLYDTVRRDPDKIVEKFRLQLSAGDIVVLHDTNPEADIILEQILQVISEQQFTIRPLDELLNIEPYEKQP